jgi:serine protease
VQALYEHGSVLWADPGMLTVFQKFSPPIDPFYPLQFYLKNTTNTRFGVPVDINVEPAWQVTTGDPNMLIAIVDDGVDLSSGQDWTLTSYGGFDAMCPNGCSDGNDSYDNPMPADRHGTAVAGIILGAHNGYGMAGIAPATRNLWIVRIFRNGIAEEQPIWTAVGINQAWRVGAAVINNSWGYGAQSNALAAVIDSAATYGRNGKGSIVVFTAGNSSFRGAGLPPAPLSWQANLESVIAVGALSREGNIADYSNAGEQMDLTAPSSSYLAATNCATGPYAGNVVTTDLIGSAGCNNGPSGNINFTCCFGGTSAAAPQVAGVAALVLAANPTLTAAQVKARLYAAAVPWGDHQRGKQCRLTGQVPTPTNGE